MARVDGYACTSYAQAVATTTIRVDSETHAVLVELSEARGGTLIDTVRAAAEALRRQQFASVVTAELAALAADGEAWDDYVREIGETEVADGVG